MSHHYINPARLFDSKPYGFTQAVKSQGGVLVHCSGQTAWDKDGKLLGAGDFATQCREAMNNVGHALTAAGARPADVVSVRFYVVNHKPEYLAVIGQTMATFFGPDHLPASTLLGVASLALPEFMVEIEAVAVITAV